jgi:hypothetical protein
VSHQVSLRSAQNLSPYLIQMAEIGAHDVKERLYPLDGYSGIEEVAFDAEDFQGFGLIPHQAAGDRGSVQKAAT